MTAGWEIPPKGAGVYARHISLAKHGTPDAMAARCVRNGVTWVALEGLWHGNDKVWTPGSHVLKARGAALREAGVRVWVWGYPHAGHEHEDLRKLREAALLAGADGILLDPELSYKLHPEYGSKLVSESLDALDESLGIGVTSYGAMRAHSEFPWRELSGLGFGSPQLYSANRRQFKAHMADWQMRWHTVIPSIAAYGTARVTLRERFKHLEAGGFDRCIIWSWRQIHGAEWGDIKRWSEKVRT